jgi:hypothetical protein
MIKLAVVDPQVWVRVELGFAGVAEDGARV